MRTTVGPLPPAVYWRRRVVVLGALLLGLIVLFVSCSGGGDDRPGGQAASAPAPASQASSTPEETPSFSDPQPGTEPSLPAPDEVQSQQPPAGTAPSAGAPTADVNVTAPGAPACADQEMAVTPVPAATRVRRGQPLQIHLKIRNASARACNRDVGADPQEIYIEQGGRKVWSSDTCGTARGSDLRTFAPGAERDYVVTWNGRTTTACAGGLAAGPAPAPGTYQVRGRLGNRAGTAVALTVTG